jgi:hypothetical protein
MIELSPPFMTYYVPPFLTYGGIRFNPLEYKGPEKFKNDVNETVEEIGKSLERSYDVKTRVENPDEYSIVTELKPLSSGLDKKSMQINLKKTEIPFLSNYIKYYTKKMIDNNKNSAIVTRNNGYDVFHILKESFNTEDTEILIKSVEALLFSLGGYAGKFYSSLNDNILKIKLKLSEPPSSMYL